ncbi:MAG: sulfatase-like hydrolase/transferase [Planctomycetota bacterium]
MNAPAAEKRQEIQRRSLHVLSHWAGLCLLVSIASVGRHGWSPATWGASAFQWWCLLGLPVVLASPFLWIWPQRGEQLIWLGWSGVLALGLLAWLFMAVAGDALWSDVGRELVGQQLTRLWHYIPMASIARLFSVLVVSCLAVVSFHHWGVRRIGRRFVSYPKTLVLFVFLIFFWAIAVATWPQWSRSSWICDGGSALPHPFRTLGLVRGGSELPQRPTGREAEGARSRAEPWMPAADTRVQQWRLQGITRIDGEEIVASDLPDVLIVIAESLRPEVIDPAVMPHCHHLARAGFWARGHYSGGNASSLGIFSLLNGLEAFWFHRSAIRYAPALPSLMKRIGYDVGFFGGHDDWDRFQMDAFIRPELYAEFRVFAPEPGLSDPAVLQRVRSFLTPITNARSGHNKRSPRIAISYLYTTHAPFVVEPAFAVDQPTANANYPIPYSEHQLPAVYNRYRNAARTLDHWLSKVISPDRITIVVGDHGESFLDDATIGHGTRLSRAQCQTPWLMYGPGVKQRSLETVTTHADVLPTLLGVLGLQVTRADMIDGVDCSLESPPADRVVSVSHYLGPEIGLLGPWTKDRRGVWAYRNAFSVFRPQIACLGAVDDRGAFWQGIGNREKDQDQQLVRWLSRRLTATE